MKRFFRWLSRPIYMPDLHPEELEEAKRMLKYLERRASLMGVSVPREGRKNGE